MGSMQIEFDLVRGMTQEQRNAFEMRMASVRKTPSTAVILSLFGFGRFYLDEIGLGVLQWILAPFLIGLLWMFIDIFTASSRTEAYNEIHAIDIAQTIRSQYPAFVPAPAGSVLFCSACGTEMSRNEEACSRCGAQQGRAVASKTLSAPMKKCPACAEMVLFEAKKCRYCGELFPAEIAPSQAAGQL